MGLQQVISTDRSALFTLDQLKGELTIDVAALTMDLALVRLTNRVSSIVNHFLNKRTIWQGKVADISGDMVASVLLGAGALTIAKQPVVAQPNYPACCLLVEVVSPSVTAGKVTITGLNPLGVAQSEVYDFQTSGLRYGSPKAYSSITSIVVSGLAGNTGADTIRVTSVAPYIDYHSILKARDSVFSREAPIVSNIDLYQDNSRSYSSGTLLSQAADGDYVYTPRTGRLWRVAGATPLNFFQGVRVLRHRYTAGVLDDAFKSAVPASTQSVALQFAAFLFREIERRNQGTAIKSDISGHVTKFAARTLTAAYLTDVWKAELWNDRRIPSSTVEVGGEEG